MRIKSEVRREVSGDKEPVPLTKPDPKVAESQGVDTVDLQVDLSQRAAVMKTTPHFL